MISKISFIKTDNVYPYRNLAVEKFLTLNTEEEECILFLWQNRKTVVIGRNQNAWNECNVGAVDEDGGYLVRRLSGGGAVFHDLGNLNFTFCVRKNNYDLDKQLSVLVQAVKKLGLEAEKTGRNDVVINGRKFSGNAFLEIQDYCYHHGTIMLDVSKEKMARYLNVSKEKLASKGVESVKSRVVNLKELCPQITVDMISEKLREAFGEVYGLEPEDFPKERLDEKSIEENEKIFSSWEWKFGRKIPFSHEIARRFSWGDIRLQLDINEGIIKDAECYSDAMEENFILRLAENLRGVRYEAKAMTDAVRKMEHICINQEQMIEDICGLITETAD